MSYPPVHPLPVRPANDRPRAGLELEGPRGRRYVLDQPLHAESDAGFSTVWRATGRDDGKAYAVKILRTGGGALMDGHDIREAYQREVTLLGDVKALRCPHIIEMVESFEQLGLFCIVTALAEGGSLKARMREQSYTLADVFRWAWQLATALQQLSHLPGEAVIHGDLKPDNVLLTSTGDALLADLGIGAWVRGRAGLQLPPWAAGPVAHRPPELRPPGGRDAAMEDHVMRHAGGAATDVWALGVCLYLLLLRKDPTPYYSSRQPERVAEVDAIATREDAVEHLQREVLRLWGAASGEDSEGRRRALVAVTAGTLRLLVGRMTAEQVLRELAEADKPDLGAVRQAYNQQLAQRLRARRDLMSNEQLSLPTSDIVPLDLLPNKDFHEALTRPHGDRPGDGEEEARAPTPVSIEQVVKGEVCGQGLSFLVGPPGAGKTTLLYHLALRMAEQAGGMQQHVPVVVHAQDLQEHLKGLAGGELHDAERVVGCLRAAVDEELQWPGCGESLRQLALQGREPAVVLLVDGLDEVAERHNLLKRLGQVVQEARTAGEGGSAGALLLSRVIVCSRPGAFESLVDHGQFKAVLRVLPLDKERSEKLAATLLQHWHEMDDDLISTVQRLAAETFAGSPLLVYLLCRLARETRSVPQSRAQLYEDMATYYLRRNAEQAGARDRGGAVWDKEGELRLCGLVAYVVHRLGFKTRSEVVTQQEVDDGVLHVLRCCPASWAGGESGAAMLGRLGGLFSRQQRRDYRFIHRTMQEYLAARFLASEPPLPADGGWAFDWSRGEHIASDWWAEVYRFAGLRRGPGWLAQRMLACNSEAEALEWLVGIKRECMDNQDVGFCRLRHVLHACTTMQPSAVDLEMARRVAEAVVAVYDRHRDMKLALVFDPAAMGTSAWRTFPPDALGLITRHLVMRVHKMPHLRGALDALCLIGEAAAADAETVAGLVAMLRSDEKPQHRRRAAQAITSMAAAFANDMVVVRGLLSAMQHAPKPALAALRAISPITPHKQQVWDGLVAAAASLPPFDGHPGEEMVKELVRFFDELAGRLGKGKGAVAELLQHNAENVRRIARGLVACVTHDEANSPLADLLAELDPRAALDVDLTSATAVSEALAGPVRRLLSSEEAEECSALVEWFDKGGADDTWTSVVLHGLRGGGTVCEQVLDALASLNYAKATVPATVVDAVLGLCDESGPAGIVTEAVALVARLCQQEGTYQPAGLKEVALRLARHADEDVSSGAVRLLGSVRLAAGEEEGMVEALASLLTGGDSGDDPIFLRSAARTALSHRLHVCADQGVWYRTVLARLRRPEGDAATRATLAELLGEAMREAPAEHGVVQELVLLLRSESPAIREGSLRALAEMGKLAAAETGVVSTVVELVGDTDSSVRERAVTCLGGMGEAAAEVPGVVQAVVGAARDPAHEVRRRAAWGLGELGRGPAVVALRQLLEDKDGSVREQAAGALGRAGEAAVAHAGVLERLVVMLADESDDAASQAAKALCRMGQALTRQPAAMTALVCHLDAASSKACLRAMRVLAGVGDAAINLSGVADRLLGLLTREDKDVQASATRLLCSTAASAADRPGLASRLLDLLASGSDDVRRHALEVLAVVGEAAAGIAGATDRVVDVLASSALKKTRALATTCLMQFTAEPRVVEALACVYYRGECRELLLKWAQAGGAERVKAFITALQGCQVAARRVAVLELLRDLGEEAGRVDGVVEALTACLTDEAGDVRHRAAQALDAMAENVAGRPHVVEALASLLRDQQSRVRAVAATVLGKMSEEAGGRPGVVKGLMELVGDSDSAVRDAARGALQNIEEDVLSKPEMVEVLVGLMQHTGRYERASASKVHLDLSRRARTLLRRQRGQKRPAETDP